MSSCDREDVVTSNGNKKRKRNIVSWKHNQRKIARLHGQEYVGKNGKHIEAKTVGPTCM